MTPEDDGILPFMYAFMGGGMIAIDVTDRAESNKDLFLSQNYSWNKNVALYMHLKRQHKFCIECGKRVTDANLHHWKHLSHTGLWPWEVPASPANVQGPKKLSMYCSACYSGTHLYYGLVGVHMSKNWLKRGTPPLRTLVFQCKCI